DRRPYLFRVAAAGKGQRARQNDRGDNGDTRRTSESGKTGRFLRRHFNHGASVRPPSSRPFGNFNLGCSAVVILRKEISCHKPLHCRDFSRATPRLPIAPSTPILGGIAFTRSEDSPTPGSNRRRTPSRPLQDRSVARRLRRTRCLEARRWLAVP